MRLAPASARTATAAIDAAQGWRVRNAGTLVQGTFRSLEHSTSGAALIVELADGARFLRLESLDTSNGPDLRVILSDRAPSRDRYGYADGDHLDLGGLKGNIGSSNYAIPEGTDLSRFRSAVIWCRRFAVGFGVAPVAASAKHRRTGAHLHNAPKDLRWGPVVTTLFVVGHIRCVDPVGSRRPTVHATWRRQTGEGDQASGPRRVFPAGDGVAGGCR